MPDVRQQAIEAAKVRLREIWHDDAWPGHGTIPEQCQYCNESAAAAYDAMADLIRADERAKVAEAIRIYADGLEPEMLNGKAVAEFIADLIELWRT